ncbi:MAG TPA: hypothetical protein PKV72_01910 [Candidatus Peribacteria bacterium]|nr:hypothetical protein [Candidatus Peribacteria bacterium]
MHLSQRTILILSVTLFTLAVFWGGYTLLAYIGVPIHQLVYSTPQQLQALDSSCGTTLTPGTLMCRGTAYFFPFIAGVLKTGSPFLPYVIVSLLVYIALIVFAGFTSGRFSMRFKLRPAMLVIFFALSAWLMGTTLSMGTLYNVNTPQNSRVMDQAGNVILPPFTRFYEPTATIYGGASPQALTELKANYESLLARGCLSELGQLQGGTRIYDLRFLCMQQSMFQRVGAQFLLLLILTLNLLVVGRFLLVHALRLRNQSRLVELMLSLGVGTLAWIAMLWFVAVLGGLNFAVVNGWTVTQLLFFLTPFAFFPQSWYWLKASWQPSTEVELQFKDWFVPLAWLLITYLALNFLNVVRPFPIGWDDLGSYLNRPRLLASYGSIIPSMSQFQWEYMSAVGYLLFGLESIVGSTFAMQINWLAGAFALLSVYAFARMLMGPRRGAVAAALYYMLPMTGHFSFADMKVDNAVFFTGVLAMIAMFAYQFGTPGLHEEHEHGHAKPRDRRLLFVAGLLAALSFAMKPTAILTIILLVTVLIGAMMGWLAFLGSALLSFAVLLKEGPLNVSDIVARAALNPAVLQPVLIFGVLIIAGLACLGYATYMNRPSIKPTAQAFGIFIAGLLVACAPWMAYNLSTATGVPFSVGNLLKAQDLTAPQVFYVQKDELPEMSPVTPVRYLPPELKVDVNNAACKTSARTEELDRYWGFDTGLSHYVTLAWRQVMNVDSFGYYVTLIPLLLLVPLLLFLPFFWMPQARWLRFLFAGTMVFFLQWSLVANGISWYGIGMFLGFAVILEAFAAYAPDPWSRGTFSGLIVMSILICLVNRFWQFDTQKNLFEYPLGKVTAEALREVTIPDYDDIRDSVLSRHEGIAGRPYTYRIGTFISYFIPKNREILPLADHQLQFFNCINQEQNHALTLKRLQALGFNSLIFDTNTQTIEKDPNGSLHQKVNAFLSFANDASIGLQIAVNDPGNGIAYIILP